MKAQIKKILESLHPETNFDEVTDSLVSDGVIDSFDIVQVISDLEAEFSISISALDLLPENYESIEDIENLVLKYKN